MVFTPQDESISTEGALIQQKGIYVTAHDNEYDDPFAAKDS